MTDLYVVSDVHGRREALTEALFSAGLFDNHGKKASNAHIVHIGDLANCVRSSVEGDLECLSMVGNEIDLLLMGNHEMPYFDATNSFGGFHYDIEIGNKLHELRERGLLCMAAFLNDCLITHAGVSCDQLNFGTGTTAAEVAEKLNHEWQEGNYNYPLFRDCGYARYGNAPTGGVLWCDFDQEFEPTPFSQIVGHTPGVLRMNGNALCIDTGAKSEGKPTILKVS